MTTQSETWQSSTPHHYVDVADNAGKIDRTVFDDLGQLKSDRVTTLGAGVDGAVRPANRKFVGLAAGRAR